MNTLTVKKQLVETFGVFSKEKILKKRPLNLIGIQAFRLVMARVWDLFLAQVKGLKPKNSYERELISKGFLKIDNFLDSTTYNELKTEVFNLIENEDITSNITKYGPATKYTYNLNKIKRDEIKAISKYFENETIKKLFTLSEKSEFKAFHPKGVRHIEIIVQNEVDSSEHDVETELHSDTFFNTTKSWLYFTNVELEDAPLVVVPTTHHLSWIRIKNAYLNSISKKPQVSRRISQEELLKSGSEELKVLASENTLVVANTLVYHRRSTGVPGRKRIALHISERSSPFKL